MRGIISRDAPIRIEDTGVKSAGVGACREREGAAGAWAVAGSDVVDGVRRAACWIEPGRAELGASHHNHENVHDQWRDNYRVGANSLDARTKRRGKAWRQLRADAALVLEWLRIDFICGWLGSARRLKAYAPVRSLRKGLLDLRKCEQQRRDAGLDLPYGEVAEALYYGSCDTPPPIPLRAA